MVHAGFAAEAEHVLRGDIAERRARLERELDQAPARLLRVEARRRALVAASGRGTSRRSCRCRGCSCTRPGSRGGSRGACGLSGEPPKAQWRTTIPGRSSSSRRRRTAGVITPRSSAISGSSPSALLDGLEELDARPAPPAAVPRRLVRRRDRPVGDESAEVVDARDVDELGDAAEALDPPAVARRTVRRPVVERVAPVLAVRAQRVRRRAGDLAVREELRPRLDVGALVGDVDRDVADQAHAALARVRAQRAPFALEAHLARDRSRRRRSAPTRRPRTGAGRRSPRARPRRRARRGRRAARARRRRRSSCGRASRTRPAARAGASATTTGPPPRASRRTGRPPGRDGRRAARSDGGGSPRSAAASRRRSL